MALLPGAGIAMVTLTRIASHESVGTKVNQGVAAKTNVLGQSWGITTEHWKASVKLDAM